MNKQDAIKFCRYYHGESECPFKDDERSTLWMIEIMWTEKITRDIAEDFLDRALQEYIAYGLGEFQIHDGVPISLKAVLFNRLCKYEERIDLPAFKQFYLRFYN